MAIVTSINVGMPRDVPWQGRTVRTGIWKAPVPGRVFAGRLNLAGDGQGDLDGHGGEQRAVMVYQVESYRYWEAYLGRPQLEPGSFGENFTVDGLPDSDVCIGDRYRIGEAVFEVTQPRVTCYRVGMRLEHAQLPALLVAHHRPGFYFRVIQEGFVEAGNPIVKVADGPERMTIAEVDALLYSPDHPVETLQRAVRVAALSAGWRASFSSLLEAARKGDLSGNVGLISAVPKPAWAGFRPLRVAAIVQESLDIRSFTLEAPDGSQLPAYLPGQHLVLRLNTDDGGPIVARIYSLCGAGGAYRIAVKNEGGAGSRFLNEHVRVGDMLDASAPRGTFILGQADTPLVLLSGGVGITPMLAMLYAAVAGHSLHKREIWWIHSARNGANHAFAHEVRGLLAGMDAVHSWVVYSRPDATDSRGADYGYQGHVDAPWLREIGVPKDADFYLCGPSAFMVALEGGLEGWGVARERIHSEVFGSGPSLTPGIVVGGVSKAPHQPDGPPGSGPSVTFLRSGLTTRWNARFNSLLELAEACSVPVRWSCRTGVCHNCESGLVDGQVRYDPQPLDPPADGSILLCCSAPSSDVELDL